MFVRLSSTFLFVILELSEATSSCNNTNPCHFIGGDDLKVPTEYSSDDTGYLNVTLTVDLTPHKVDWLTIHRRAYNGEIPGPTLRVRPGDKLCVNLVNKLGRDQVVPTDINGLHTPNTTNLHVHGMYVSPKEPQDNVFVSVESGSSYQYEYDIPDDHPAGTYWYHHHHHGSGLFNVGGGLVGLLIVEDDVSTMSAELSAISCPLNCHKEVRLAIGTSLRYMSRKDVIGRFVSFAFQQSEWRDTARHKERLSNGNGTLEQWLMDPVNGVDYLLTNGQLWPSVSLTVGEARRLRIVNTAPIETLEITIKDLGCQMLVLAWDGLYVDAPYPTNMVVLSSGARVDVALRCSSPGTFTMMTVIADENDVVLTKEYPFFRSNQTLVIFNVKEPTAASDEEKFPTSLPARPDHYRDLRMLRDSEIDGRFVVEWDYFLHANRELYKGPTYPRYKYEAGSIQEWYIINTGQFLPHPFHMHINHFQVISYNEYTHPWSTKHPTVYSIEAAYYDLQGNLCEQQYENFNRSLNWPNPNIPNLKYIGHHNRSRDNIPAYIPLGEWRDSIVIPPLASITIRFLAGRFTGNQLVHCHNLLHGDLGMMVVAEIVEAGESTDGAFTASGGAYPGTCRRDDPYPDVVMATTDPTYTVVTDEPTVDSGGAKVLTRLLTVVAVGSIVMFKAV